MIIVCANRALTLRIAALALLLLLSLPSTLHAAQLVEEIRIEATRSPTSAAEVIAPLTVIGATATRARPQQGLDESLATIPGVFFQNRYNYAQDLRIAIRGFGARANFGIRGIKLIVDGIPTTLPDGQGSVDSLDLASIERIEVIRGTSSSLYGNASGGIILIESGSAAEQPFVESRLAYGADGFRKSQLKAGGRSGDLDYLVSLVDQHSDGYRDHSSARNALVNTRLQWRIDQDTRLNLVFNRTDQPEAEDPGGVNAQQLRADRRSARDQNVALDAGEALDQSRLGLRLRKQFGDDELSISNYYLWRNFDGRIPLASNGVIQFERQVRGLTAGYHHQRNDGELRFTLGLDFAEQDDDRQRFANLGGTRGNQVLDQHETVRNAGVYLQSRWQPAAHWQLTAGLRYDEVKFIVDDRLGDSSGRRTLSELSPELGVSYTPTDDQQFYLRAATAFETPTTTELAESGSTGLNPDLQPQLAESVELGWRGSLGEHLQATANLFDIRIDDEIIGAEDAMGDSFFVNAGESSRQGLELSLAAQLHETVSLQAAYSWSDFEFEQFRDEDNNDFAGNRLPGAPQHLSSVQLDYQQSGGDGWFASFEARYVDRFALDNANSAFSKRYLLADARVAYRWQWQQLVLEPFAGINNVFDRDYVANHRLNAFGGRYFEAGPGRSFYGGLTARLDARP